MSIYGGGMLNINYVIVRELVFSAGEGQSENDLNKVESERERKLKKKSAEEAKDIKLRNNPNEKLFYSMNENQNGSSRDRRESRDKKLFQNEKVNEIFINLRIFHFFTIFLYV